MSRSPPPAPPIRAIIVEDDDGLQDAIHRTLRAIAPTIEVVWVASAEHALKEIRRKPFQFVILDYYLSSYGPTGFWVLDKCRKQYPETEFVIMSGMSVDEFLQLIDARTKAPRFLRKPFSLEEFRAVAEEMIGQVKKVA